MLALSFRISNTNCYKCPWVVITASIKEILKILVRWSSNENGDHPKCIWDTGQKFPPRFVNKSYHLYAAYYYYYVCSITVFPIDLWKIFIWLYIMEYIPSVWGNLSCAKHVIPKVIWGVLNLSNKNTPTGGETCKFFKLWERPDVFYPFLRHTIATGAVATLSSPKQFPFTVFSLITKRFKLEETNYAFSLGGFMERFHWFAELTEAFLWQPFV